ALDHRRADHEFAVRPRHDIEGKARMEEPHRSREGDLARAHADHLAAHAAQLRQVRARREAPAIEHHPFSRLREKVARSPTLYRERERGRPVDAEAHVDAMATERV